MESSVGSQLQGSKGWERTNPADEAVGFPHEPLGAVFPLKKKIAYVRTVALTSAPHRQEEEYYRRLPCLEYQVLNSVNTQLLQSREEALLIGLGLFTRHRARISLARMNSRYGQLTGCTN